MRIKVATHTETARKHDLASIYGDGKTKRCLCQEFGCPPEYVADMLRDIADALTSVHPKSESQIKTTYKIVK